jgi:hypothetical protein
MAGKIKIISQGRGGKVQYSEGWLKKNVCAFSWEFGGGDTVAIVWFTADDAFDSAYPWAGGRQKEILTFVAKELRRTQTPSSTIVWGDGYFNLVQK